MSRDEDPKEGPLLVTRAIRFGMSFVNIFNHEAGTFLHGIGSMKSYNNHSMGRVGQKKKLPFSVTSNLLF